MLYCSTLMNKNKHWSMETKKPLWDAMLLLLYLNYDISLDFAPQLTSNLEMLKKITHH